MIPPSITSSRQVKPYIQELLEEISSPPEHWRTDRAISRVLVNTDGSLKGIEMGGAGILVDEEAEEVAAARGRHTVPLRVIKVGNNTHCPSSTKAEGLPILRALEAIHKDTAVHVQTDSQATLKAIESVKRGMTVRSLIKLANATTIEAIVSQMNLFTVPVKISHVKAHVGTYWNEKADQLANEARQELIGREPRPFSSTTPEPKHVSVYSDGKLVDISPRKWIRGNVEREAEMNLLMLMIRKVGEMFPDICPDMKATGMVCFNLSDRKNALDASGDCHRMWKYKILTNALPSKDLLLNKLKMTGIEDPWCE